LYKCACTGHERKIYNLAPLGRIDGKPRFEVEARDGYKFSFNPCWSFSLGSFGDCSDDVAVCMWTPASYQNIGNQSSFTCGFDEDNTPQLEYHNHDKIPGWSVVINLRCNPEKRSIESAEFTVKTDLSNPRKLLVTHNCACPNGCPIHPATDTIAPSVTPSSHGQDDWKDIGVPVVIAGGTLGLVILAVVVIWRLINRGDNQDNERRRLIGEGGIDERINNQFNEPNEGGSSRDAAQPMSTISNSCSDNTTFNKNFNTGAGSVPV